MNQGQEVTRFMRIHPDRSPGRRGLRPGRLLAVRGQTQDRPTPYGDGSR